MLEQRKTPWQLAKASKFFRGYSFANAVVQASKSLGLAQLVVQADANLAVGSLQSLRSLRRSLTWALKLQN
ncbi:hypothetical protein, partial [Aquabacterium soli]|uniref:hypothetical protein n=1 Tax=Aquabacterium soli TaxID=2493092 RepID=UPI001F1EA540